MTDGAKLIAHKGAQIVSREQLAQYIPPPATDTWKPVGHTELVETLTDVMNFRGLHIVREQFAVQNAKLFGTFDLEWQRMLEWQRTEEYGAAVGFRHATDKSMAIQIAVGARVFVCDNMSFSGDMITVRKHTSKLNLAEEMDRAMFRYIQGFQRLQDDIRLQEETLLDEYQVKSLIYDVFEKKLVPPRMFGAVASEYAHVRDNDSARTTAWWAHNLFTNHIKTMPPAPAFRATARIGKHFATTFKEGYSPV
jgi:hypothetical protein